MNATKTYAIIEIGSNTIRLIIYRCDEYGRIKKLENHKTAARLDNHLTGDHMLDESGITLLLQTLNQYGSIIRQYQLEATVCVATGTLRSANNKQSVKTLIKQQTGFAVQILSGYDEAYYAYLAVIKSTVYANGIIIDVGGGSTEVSYVKNKTLQRYHSFPFGALSLKRWFVSGSMPDYEAYQRMRQFLSKQLESLDWLTNRHEPVIGVGGNAHHVVGIDQAGKGKTTKKLHQCQITREDIDEAAAYLQPMTAAALQKGKGLSPKRAELIMPALAVFQSLMRVTGSQQFVLSRKGVRDGLLFHLLARNS